jgi:hypothetical protein
MGCGLLSERRHTDRERFAGSFTCMVGLFFVLLAVALNLGEYAER